MDKRAAQPKCKTIRDALDTISEDHATAGDISLAAFLVAYGFPGRQVSAGSIGAIGRSEALALNAMLAPQATLVALTGDPLSSQREQIADIVEQIKAGGFPLRLQFADLTLPGRWPHLLSAMAHTEIGLLGIDARWAAKDRNFWPTLQSLMKTSPMLVYIRNLFDIHQPAVPLSLIRAMPVDCALEVVATTPRSIWFAADAAQGNEMRDLLHASGLFPQAASAGSAAGPVVVLDEQALQLLDADGRLPCMVVHANQASGDALDYTSGWSEAESDGCWTAGPEATVRLLLPPGAGKPIALAVTGNPWIPPNVRNQVVSIGVGNAPTEWKDLLFTDPESILTTVLDLKDMPADGSGLIVRMKVQSPGRPSDFGSSDTRLLGFKMRSIAIYA